MPPPSYYNELQVISTSNLEQFSDFLLTLGIEAVEERDGMLIVRSEDSLENVKWGVEEFAKRLSKDVQTNLTKKSNEDWINKYKNSVKPIEVGKFYIHPSWVEEKQNFTNITIDPALAFGSGHHESTNSCLLMIEEYVKNSNDVLDVGCGSGILSIASAKLGANVDSCDTDEQAVQSTKENARLNDCKLNDTWIGSIANINKNYDIIIANIIADVLIILEKDLKRNLKQGGILILSGILDKYEDKIMQNFKNLEHLQTLAKNEWRTITFKKG